MSTGFSLHPQLAKDCIAVGQLPLSQLLMMNDAQYPWFILVPRRAAIREIHELAPPDQQQLLAESSALGAALMNAFAGEKLNLAALGNMVPQLHLHHIVRHSSDPAWPRPVWGAVPAVAMSATEIQRRLALVGSSPLLADLLG